MKNQEKCPTCGSTTTIRVEATRACMECGEIWTIDETVEAWHELGDTFLEALEELNDLEP